MRAIPGALLQALKASCVCHATYQQVVWVRTQRKSEFHFVQKNDSALQSALNASTRTRAKHQGFKKAPTAFEMGSVGVFAKSLDGNPKHEALGVFNRIDSAKSVRLQN